MSWLEIADLCKTYPGNRLAVDAVSLSVEKGEFFTIVGPSNAGKSTLLKLIAGITRSDRGTICLANRDITGLQPRERQLSLLFQNIALFPNRTGFENIAFPMKVAGISELEIERRVRVVAATVKVGHLLDRIPRTFSGGEQQRVAIARAIVHDSHLLMLDEPLTNLDARIRIALRLEFKKLHHDTGQTLLYVTHDQIEAMSMSDRIGILNSGRFEQIGTPDDIYRRPKSEFVARFIGSPPMNILDCTIAEGIGGLRAQGDGFEAPIIKKGRINVDRPPQAAVGIRPEEITASLKPQGKSQNPGKVLWIERLGPFQVLDLQLGKHIVKVRTRADHPVNREGPVWCGFEVRAEHILNRSTGLFLRAMAGVNGDANIKREEARCV